MSYQYLEVRYPTGKYRAETGYTTGKTFWDDIFHQNQDYQGFSKDQQKEIAKERLRRFMAIYQKRPEYIICPSCDGAFEEPEWDAWFIDGNHDLCPSCLTHYETLTPIDQKKFREQFQGLQT